jgi:GNAT superfamily N-acetyltransferase
VITATAAVAPDGVAMLALTARAAATQAGGGAEAAALAVRLLGDDARRRSSVDGDAALLALTVAVEGTELVVSVRDTGEPLTGPPPSVLSLVDLGLVTAADGGGDGSGNEVTVRVPLPSHGRLIDADDLEVLDQDAPTVDVAVELCELTAAHAAALTRCVYRCYGWTYPNHDLYFPDRIAAAIASGKRVGEVALTPDGEVAAHWGAVFQAEGVVETGGTVTDPRFRGRGLANQLGDRLLERLVAMGVHGRMREPVLTHPATQKIALREGATMVGLNLKSSAPLQQVGITDGVQDQRTSVTVFYSPLRPLEPVTVWVPALYEPIVRHVMEPAVWKRQMGSAHGTADAPAASVFSSSYDALNRMGVVQVTVVGADLVESLDETLGQLHHAGAEVVSVYLPATQPALASLGAGLGELRLGFAAFLPAFGDLGDALVLQWLRDPEVDDASWVYADEHVQQLANLIIDQARQLGEAATQERRRQARRAQLFAALPTGD